MCVFFKCWYISRNYLKIFKNNLCVTQDWHKASADSLQIRLYVIMLSHLPSAWHSAVLSDLKKWLCFCLYAFKTSTIYVMTLVMIGNMLKSSWMWWHTHFWTGKSALSFLTKIQQDQNRVFYDTFSLNFNMCENTRASSSLMYYFSLHLGIILY